MKRFMKSKKGFTLTELLVVLALVGIIACIAIPIYNGFTKTARVRNCSAERLRAKAEIESWCTDDIKNYNQEAFSFEITSDGKIATITAIEGINVSADDLARVAYDGKVPCCPSCGTMTVVITPRASGIPKVTITCDGGNDGDIHKSEE
jgi:prepilin-type N-terminal cleavage/methylation domain-containing protein